MKTGATMKPLSDKRENASALTSRTLEQIAKANDAQWQSNRTEIPGLNLDELPQSAMNFLPLMQCRLVTELPEADQWQYELLCGWPHKSCSVVQSVMWPQSRERTESILARENHNIIRLCLYREDSSEPVPHARGV
jgi:hypothetical protein